jgi:nitrite reductase/ring-hydroxylating ferredoxin subunit
MAWTSLCEFDELSEGSGRYVEIGGFRLAVFLDRGNVYVLDNDCPHAGGNLSAGTVDAHHAVCPRHAWAFRLDDGRLRGFAGIQVRTYPTRRLERDDKPTLIQADLPIF